MKHKVLQMKRLKYISGGCYGDYYLIGKSKVGVKIKSYCEFTNKKEALEYLRDSTLEEYNKLVVASKLTRMVPRPKGLALIVEKHGKRSTYHVGYMMTHVEGKTFADLNINAWNKAEDRKDKAATRMHQLGIYLHDDHSGNVMLTKTNRIIFIDADRFDVSRAEKKKRKKKR